MAVENYLPMGFKNIGFAVDRLGRDCAPLQYVRELTQNSMEAIKRTNEGEGEIRWDLYEDEDGIRKLCIIDNGDGMTGPGILQYINNLFSSISEQAATGNFGIGAKVAALTRNPEGLVYVSWRDGKGAMATVRKFSDGNYGIERIEDSDGLWREWVEVDDSVKPDIIDTHGTMVILMGENEDSDTFVAPKEVSEGDRSNWVASYLNSRYLKVPEGVGIRSRDIESRETTASVTYRIIDGQDTVLNTHSDASGSVELSDATCRWWVLKEGTRGGDARGSLSGHIAALYQNELYDRLTLSKGASARLQTFGVMLGFQRVVLYFEPKHPGVAANTPRTHLLIGGESLPWAEWGRQFKKVMPAEIRKLMQELLSKTERSSKLDIGKRLKDLMDLYRVSAYKRVRKPSKIKAEFPEKEDVEHTPSGKGPRKKGTIVSKLRKKEGKDAKRVKVTDPKRPECVWISSQNDTRTDGYLEDRAARYLPEENKLHINADFRVFTDTRNHLLKRYPGIHGGTFNLYEAVRDEFNTVLCEVVLSVRGLQGSAYWSEEQIQNALSEDALTNAVLPRYHIVMAVEAQIREHLKSASAA